MADTIFAAGTVCWRYTKNNEIKVLLIRRVKHNDWSLPKGKVDKGEALPATAQRETYEETGLRVNLGVNLGTINYKINRDTQKTVQYWAAKVSRKKAKKYKFKPNSEVFKVKWLKTDKAAKKLTYAADRELFSVFQKLVADGSHDTFAVTLLRHAKATPLGPGIASDEVRPLSDRGVLQAQTIVPILSAFGPRKIFSSTALRCLDTVEPLAEHLGLSVERTPGISQETWNMGETSELRDLIGQIINDRKNTLLCSHLPVLPDLTREIAAATVSTPGRYLGDSASLPPGAFSIFHIAKNNVDRGIVAIETYPIKV